MIAGLTSKARRPGRDLRAGATVIAHDGDDDAVRIANDSPYGLSGTVFSADSARGPRPWWRAAGGRVRNVNGVCGTRPTCRSAAYKQSGVGREMGVAGFEEYLG